LAAASVGFAFDVSSINMKNALNSFKSYRQRMQILEWKSVYILDDSYNANPDSMAAALEILQEFPAPGRRFAVLGDMLEIGKTSKHEHETIGHEAVKRGVNRIITVGSDSQFITERANISGFTRAIHTTGHEQAAKLLRRELKNGDVVLVKGSRGMTMEKTLEYLF